MLGNRRVRVVGSRPFALPLPGSVKSLSSPPCLAPVHAHSPAPPRPPPCPVSKTRPLANACAPPTKTPTTTPRAETDSAWAPPLPSLHPPSPPSRSRLSTTHNSPRATHPAQNHPSTRLVHTGTAIDSYPAGTLAICERPIISGTTVVLPPLRGIARYPSNQMP